jgi:NADH-quinone oxidoreductase subunit N
MSSSLPTSAQWAALMPILFPALAGTLIPLALLDKDAGVQKWIRAGVYAVALFALGASFMYLTELWGRGAQPSYLQLRLDHLAQFTGIFVVVAAALAVLQSWDHFHQEGWVKGETISLLLFSVTGMMVFASTTHLLVIFLGLELFSIPLYALTATLRSRASSSEGGLKYFITGAVAASCFLMGVAILYGLTGSLDLAVIRSLPNVPLTDPLFIVGLGLLLVGFLFKVSAAPFHQWTPDVYVAAPHPIAGFMSVATKGVAVVALIRAFPGTHAWGPVLGAKLGSALAVIAVLTLVVANLTALVQTSAKRMLAYSSISHAGYLVLGLVAGTPNALSGMLLYLAVYLAMNMGAFGLFTAFGLVGEKDTYEDLRGLGWKHPLMGLCAALILFSLAGVPPLGGFYGKYMIFKELVGTGHVSLAILGVLASLVSMGYYLRFLVALFLQAPTPAQEREASEAPVVQASLARATVLVGAILVVAAGFLQTALVDGFTFRAIQGLLGLR